MNHIDFYTHVVEEIPNKDWAFFRNFKWSENLVTPTGVTTTLPLGTRVYPEFVSPRLSKETVCLLKKHFLQEKYGYYAWIVNEANSIRNAAWNLFYASLEFKFNFETQVLTQEDWQSCLNLTSVNLDRLISREIAATWDRVEEEAREILKSGSLRIPKAPALTPAS